LRLRMAKTCFGQAQNRYTVEVFPWGDMGIVN
jgi:hypothetical protein